MNAGKKTKSHTGEPSAKLKKIFIVDDHPIFREGLTQLVNGEEDLEVCGTADTAEKALKNIIRLKPDLVLVDITLPGKNGLELIREIRKVNRKVKLLVISMHDQALYADRVLRAGGDGYLMKEEDPEEILSAVRDLLDGHLYVSEKVMAGKDKSPDKAGSPKKPRLLEKLTDAELEILESLGRGRTNVEIGRQVDLDTRKVAEHCKKIQQKLELTNTNQLIHYAVCWIESGGE